jgi:TonB family protein
MTEKRIGIIGTSVIHLIILLILLFFFTYTPIPLPSGGGILIDFGNTDMAGGLTEPAISSEPEVKPAVPQQQAIQQTNEKEIMTQDFEEAPAIEKKPEKKTDARKTVSKPVETKPKVAEKPVETKPQVNKKALYPVQGKSNEDNGSSQGIYKGKGNQGNPEGTPGAGNYGEGTGTGAGTGLGIQVGGGLENRRILALPKPEFRVQRQGKVVVEITVNRDGKVISATPGIKGTDIADADLWAAAKKAALESKFDVKTDAQPFQTQTGTITYHFKLQ